MMQVPLPQQRGSSVMLYSVALLHQGPHRREASIDRDHLSGQARRAEGLGAIWTKVKLFCTVYDPSTGGYRANYSLFVEIFAGLSIAGAVIGFLVSQRRRRPRPA